MDYREFENKHAGETIWVLGSGRTLEFVPTSFFEDKVVVATNHTFRGRVKNGFVCTNYWKDYDDAVVPVVMPENRQVPDHVPMVKPTFPHAVFIPTIEQKYSAFVPAKDWPERGRFVVGPTSLHLSLHWAVWIGAAHIVLIGADCGEIDGGNNAEGYYNEQETESVKPHSHHKLWEKTLIQMAEKIRSFGVSVHSLNPWVTFSLEGHSWSQVK